MTKPFGASLGGADMRAHNRRAILRAIYAQGTTSRAALSRQLSMSKPAVSENLAPLLACGLVLEIGEGKSANSGGRRPVMLRIDDARYRIIAIDLNRTEPIFALGDLHNRILSSFSIESPEDKPRGRYLDGIHRGIGRLLTENGVAVSDLVRIAFAVPGIYDEKGNLVKKNDKYVGITCASVNLSEMTRDLYGVTGMVINDVNAAALGEWVMSPNSDVQNMLYVSCGQGFGSGIILDGQLYAGRHFAAGEMYNCVDKERLRRGVGLEEDICVKSLIRRVAEAAPECLSAKTLSGESNLGVGFSQISAAYDAGNPVIREIVRDICRDICVLSYNCASLLDVELVVFGGDYRVFGDTLLEEMGALHGRWSMTEPEIALSTTGHYDGIHGLLHLARERYFDEVCALAPKRA